MTLPHKQTTPIPLIAHKPQNNPEAKNSPVPDSEFLTSICHELKTPLNAIIGFADELKQEINNPQSVQECSGYVSEIIEAAADLNELVHDLLDIGQVSAGRFTADLSKKIDVGDIVKKTVRLNRDYALRCGVNLSCEVFADIKPINLDAKRMKQILMNLISNAIKYSRAGSDVRVVCNMTEGCLEISVIDQGFGMNEEQLKIAFTKYGTIANENSLHVDSLGLGLPITKQLIEIQNGTLEVKSEIGKGTEMKIRFLYLM